jgi:hypothetical protein
MPDESDRSPGVRISNERIYDAVMRLQGSVSLLRQTIEDPRRGVLATQDRHERELKTLRDNALTSQALAEEREKVRKDQRTNRRFLVGSFLTTATAAGTVLYAVGHLH